MDYQPTQYNPEEELSQPKGAVKGPNKIYYIFVSLAALVWASRYLLTWYFKGTEAYQNPPPGSEYLAFMLLPLFALVDLLVFISFIGLTRFVLRAPNAKARLRGLLLLALAVFLSIRPVIMYVGLLSYFIAEVTI